MASLSPLLLAVLIVAAVVILIVVVLIAASQRNNFKSGSTVARQPCTAPPFEPTDLSVANSQADIIVLQWDFIANADQYTAYLGETPSFNPVLALAHRTTKANSTSFGNLTLGKTYYLKVAAVNACGTSELSPEISYTLPFVFPDRFVIANRLLPALEICDRHTDPVFPDNRVTANRYCSFRDAWAYYEPSDLSIRQSDRTNYCLAREANLNVSFLPCTGGAEQKWSYSADTQTLCSPTNPTGACLVTAGTNTTVRVVNHGAPGADSQGDWIFKPV